MWKIVAAVVVVGLLGFGGYVFMRALQEAGRPLEQNNVANMESQETGGTFSGSIKDLAMRGGSWRCTMRSETSMGSVSGVVHVSGTRVHGTFDMTVPVVGAMQTYFIADDANTYTWSSAMPEGVKTTRASLDQAGEVESSDVLFSPNMNMTYTCNPETVDETLFTPPANVTFREV